VKRRLLLKQLLYTSGGLIGASLLPGCQWLEQQVEPIFGLDLLQPETHLPDHIITPLSEFYVQSYALPPNVKVEDWQLKITGALTQPLTLTFRDILAEEQQDFYLTMECIGNPAGGNLIGNAQWTGTPLLPFLERVGVKPEATEFILHGADSYETTLPVAEVMRKEVQLVHQMNGEPLTQAHGYPLRILIPGHFGQKQPKWLVGIEAISDRKRGFWERQGWSNTAEIPTHALVRQVQNTRVWNRHHRVSFRQAGETSWGKGILIAGVALDKSSPIAAIQVSTNGGQTWEKAEQNAPPSPHEWTLWRYLWKPEAAGTYTLLARAVSQREQQQLEDKNHKDGSTGVLRIQVTLQG
jgi:DMSO/TMAO reductase YedYZ molybdopterin-dependent catalytic subunit